MQAIAQNLVFGLFIGGIYGVAAAGLALVFGVLKLLNVAHGELLMVGGYVTFWLFTRFGLDPFLSLLISIPTLFVVGVALDRLVFRYLVRLEGEARIKNSMLVSFGLALILQNLALEFFTADERTVQLGYAGAGLVPFGVSLPYTRLISLCVAFLAVLAVHRFLHSTYPGKAVLAVAEDSESAALAGIDVRRVYLYTLGIGAGLAGLAGSLVVVGYGIEPSIGLSWTLKVLIVVVLAGTGSVLGAFPAGLLLGLVEAISGTAFGPIYRETAGLLLFLIVLLLRPNGLFGRG